MIQVLRRAAQVLQSVGEMHAPSFTDIRQATDLNKATLSRILASLTKLGFLERASDRSYSVGPLLLGLARPALKRESLSAVAERHARALAEKLGELVTVGTVRHGHRYNLAKATVNRSITVDAELHMRPSPYDTATGRMMLAHLSDPELAEVIEANGLPAEGWPEVSNREELTAELQRIRAQGHAARASPDGEAEALAVPVFGPEGTVCAAVGTGIPRYRLDDERRAHVLAVLGRAAGAMAEELSLEMGRRAEEMA